MQWLFGLLLVVVVVAFWVFSTYNGFISLKNKCEEAFSTMDVYLTKRYDMIPNLVETVKGYAKHESGTLEAVIKARNSYVSATTPEDKIEATNQLTGAISKLFALSESYPELKANQNFLSLQNDLKETEDKISITRQFYNDTVLKYNNKIEMVPSNIVANMAGFTKAKFFEVSETDKEVPKVAF